MKIVNYSIITFENFKSTKWAGGTTTELFIFPPDSEYQKRNFSFRLSTAKVETEKSDFTSLPGISRKIMVLDGEVVLKHKNHYSKQLDKFDTDTFEGDWKTTSVGKCTDFNLMARGKTKGEISAIVLEKNQVSDYIVKVDCDWLFMYLYSGKVGLNLNSNEETLNKGGLLVLKQFEEVSLSITGLEKSELVISEIFKFL